VPFLRSRLALANLLTFCLFLAVFPSAACLFLAVAAALRSPLAQSSAAVAEAALLTTRNLASNNAANNTRFGECGGCEGACLACCLLLASLRGFFPRLGRLHAVAQPLAWGEELTHPYFVSSDASLSRSSPVLTTLFC